MTTAIMSSASAPLSNFSTETIEVVREFLSDLVEESDRFRTGRQACSALAASWCAESADQAACRDQAITGCYQTFGLNRVSRPPQPEVYFIHARLDLLEDDALRARLRGLPTSLQLPADDVQALIEAAPEILLASPDFRRLVADIGGTLER